MSAESSKKNTRQYFVTLGNISFLFTIFAVINGFCSCQARPHCTDNKKTNNI